MIGFLKPPFFSYLILALYALNVVHHLGAGLAGQISAKAATYGVCYWLSAAAITATVTFLAPK